ncbi:hypothetical protein I7I50_12476 [Histoplasma capsulatum G186AR]|uniref:Uncharacterized protein n=1 Tax=Ajellomyces capsulatus TaxID=5037 RepID=A0A8H7YDM1_AJECA|nr:hypothetical protein I7I52_11217 [Histoplasma capsulatum]QSS70744.1 hypothetical protein I7I50_12476 [Histoplasma capsulatum G186AR]
MERIATCMQESPCTLSSLTEYIDGSQYRYPYGIILQGQVASIPSSVRRDDHPHYFFSEIPNPFRNKEPDPTYPYFSYPLSLT